MAYQVTFLVAYGRLKAKENFKLLTLKVFKVAYERWSLAGGSKCTELTWKRLVFWKTGRRGDVVAYEMWSQPGGSTVFHTTDVRWGIFIENLTAFLRVIANIPIQTLILSPWPLLYKKIVSQLELSLPVHLTAKIGTFLHSPRNNNVHS